MPITLDGTAGITNDATDLNYTGTLTGGTGVINIGSGQLYKDASGKVGIGTSSPVNQFVVADSSANGLEFIPAGTSILSVYNRNTSAYVPFRIDTSQFSAFVAGANRILVNASGDFQFNNGYGSLATVYGCRAWVNFDGTTAPGTIRSSANVSSVTRNSTGDYTVNFTTAMPDANYSVSGMAGRPSANTAAYIHIRNVTGALTTTSVRVGVLSDGGTFQNATDACISIHR
jgi:hypothetical protein